MYPMAEEASPAAKRAKVDSDGATLDSAKSGARVNGGNGKVAFVTGITGQVRDTGSA